MPKTVLFVMRDDGDMTEPMNIMLLSALAKREGFETDLVVLEHEDVVDAVKRKKPDIVAFSAITGSHKKLLEANRQVKAAAPTVKTVIGGPYATFYPQLIRREPFDAVGVGECDEAWPQLLQKWSRGESPDDVYNIVTQGNVDRVLMRSLVDGWKIQPSHLRPRMVALDDLPFMDRELIYSRTAFKDRYKRTMMAGRGCPFRCTYCFEHAWNNMYEGKGKVLQRHSVQRLCDELRQLKERWDTRYIKFYDDVFPVFDKTDDAWLEEFAEVYPREVGLPFHCLVRAEQVSDEKSVRKLKLLKQAGIASITMSIESGNAFVRDYVLIRDMTGDDLKKAFAACRELRIPTFANTILAVPAPTLPKLDAPQAEYDKQLKLILDVAREVDPKRKAKVAKLEDRVKEAQASGSTESERRVFVDDLLQSMGVRARQIDYDLDSIRFNAEVGVSFGEFPIFFPYPGTQLGDYAKKHGYFNGDYDSLHESYQTQSPLGCFTPEEKQMQQNLALLGTIVLWWAGSYNKFVNGFTDPVTWFSTEVLADKSITAPLLRLYSIAKNDMHRRRIYPMRMSLLERGRYLWENLALDLFKQIGARIVRPEEATKGPKRWGPFKHRGDRPGQTLGGPPSV